MTASVTLNGLRGTSARAYLSKWGRWYAEAQVDGEHTLTGAVTLQMADLTLSGTVISGGPMNGRSAFRVVGGKGTWGKTVPAKSYANDAGETAATVLGDAAREVGETMAPVDRTLRVGPNFTRREGPAARVLQQIAPQGWYVDEAGVTHIGKRAPGALVGNVTRIEPVDHARARVVLAADSIATILPGVVVDGLEAVDVMHELTATSGLRSTVWGARGTQTGSTLDSLRLLLEQLDPDRAYRGVTEYRVDIANGKRLNLQPVRPASSGMPYLKNVPVRPGIAGADAEVALASRVLVGFIDSDRSRPYVAAFEDADGDYFVPTTLTLAKGTSGVAREGDEVTISIAQFAAATPVAAGSAVTISHPMKASISTGSTKVKCG